MTTVQFSNSDAQHLERPPSLELEPRSRFFKEGASDGYASLAQAYDVLGRINDAREAYLNAYRLRVELADTDPTNEFAATQVLKSRLDIFKLRTHADDGRPLSFTETQALAEITSLRLEAREGEY